MTLTVITGWSPSGWEQYGRQFFDTFDQFWPEDVDLIVYGESPVGPLLVNHRMQKRLVTGRSVTFTPLSAIRGCMEFLARHDPQGPAGGCKRLPQHHWKERAVAAGYNWRFDAWKFCRQAFIPLHAALTVVQQRRFLCWLDGDVVTQSRVASSRVITDLLPTGKVIAYLGREPKHPDIAFQLYDLEAERAGLAAMGFLREFSQLYETDEVFRLPEWHSAYVWRHALRTSGLLSIAHNLTPNGSGHVWHQSPLRAWGDHLKGDRKKRGKSPEARSR